MARRQSDEAVGSRARPMPRQEARQRMAGAGGRAWGDSPEAEITRWRPFLWRGPIPFAVIGQRINSAILGNGAMVPRLASDERPGPWPLLHEPGLATRTGEAARMTQPPNSTRPRRHSAPMAKGIFSNI
jgi:hypothetical protein